MTPHEFLLCFDGFAAAIGGKPTAKQWAGLLEQRAKANGSGDLPANAAMPATTSAAPAVPAYTESGWKAAFKAELLRTGADQDTAQQLTAQEPVNLALDPVVIAKSAFSVD